MWLVAGTRLERMDKDRNLYSWRQNGMVLSHFKVEKYMLNRKVLPDKVTDPTNSPNSNSNLVVEISD